jgi:predicted nucleotidyltransferase
MWGGQSQLPPKAGRLREDSNVQAIDRSTVIARLREYQQELKAAGIVRLSLFGSVARGDQSLESDVDLVAEFDPAKQFSLLELVGLENRLADILGARVELTPARTLKDPIRGRVAREAVHAF